MEKIFIILEIIYLIVFFCYIVYNIRRRFDVEYGSLDNEFIYGIIQDTLQIDCYYLILLPSKGMGQRSRGRVILQGSKRVIDLHLKWDEKYYSNTKTISLLTEEYKILIKNSYSIIE